MPYQMVTRQAVNVPFGNRPNGTPTWVAAKSSIDAETRARIAAWLNYKMKRNGLNVAATAEIMGVSRAAVSRVKTGARTPGLDFVLAMWRKLHIPIDRLLETMPPMHEADGTEPLKSRHA